jgi:hypothetical protein
MLLINKLPCHNVQIDMLWWLSPGWWHSAQCAASAKCNTLVSNFRQQSKKKQNRTNVSSHMSQQTQCLHTTVVWTPALTKYTRCVAIMAALPCSSLLRKLHICQGT